MTLSVIAGVNQAKEERRILGYDFGAQTADMQLKTFQKIGDHSALATTGRGDVVCVVAYWGQYYEGMTLSGKFIREGTYSYENLNGTNR